MKLTSDFLLSLHGLPLNKAYDVVLKSGLYPMRAVIDTAISAVARPNSVILWYDNKSGAVVKASAGDPLQLR